ncbi:MAG: hypothetical protein ACLULH_02130 [Bacteroides fragilis]
MMGKGKEEKEKGHIIILYREIYRREGKGDLPRKGEGEVFAGGKIEEKIGNLTER